MHFARGPVRLLIGAATVSQVMASTSTSSLSAAINSIGSSGSYHTPRVLAIQSHTVHGYVGNKAATFPLQCLGFNVDAINSISLSNHPGYTGGCKGKSLSPEDLGSLVEGLDANDLLNYDIILTGYTRSVEIAEQTAKVINKIMTKNPNVLYVLDPVLGDDGRFYVPSELADRFKTDLLPLASIVVPNQFEAEVLSGLQITSLVSAQQACSVIHSLGAKLCILKGLHLDKNDLSKLSILLSISPEAVSVDPITTDVLRGGGGGAYHHSKDSGNILLRLDVPKVAGKFSGCGDLFTALVTGLLSKTGTAARGKYDQEIESVSVGKISRQEINVGRTDTDTDTAPASDTAASDATATTATVSLNSPSPASSRTLFMNRWSIEDLALVLEHVASAMHDVISSTKHANNNELRIVESIDSYRRISQPLKEVPRSLYYYFSEDEEEEQGRVERSISADTLRKSSDDVANTLHSEELTPSMESAVSAAALRSLKLKLKRLPFPSAYLASAAITGIIFDMDGTLTEPGAINFSAMYRRCGLNKADGDLVSQIDRVEDPVRRDEMYAIVKDEEMKGCERMKLRPDLLSFMESLHRARIRAAISTRNCEEAYIHFLQSTGIPLNRFYPALTRESLDGVNKPDPRVARHIVSSWETSAESTWFIGDSEDDMRCGKEAGCRTCLVLTTYNRYLLEEDGLVDVAVETLSDFGRHIGLHM